mgnify:CR=1 FL=1
MDKQEQIRLGVVMERRLINNPWRSHDWRTVAVIPGAKGFAEWQEMDRGSQWTRFYAGNLPLNLYRKETEGYRTNLSQPGPSLYVVLRSIDEEYPRPFLVTACPYEAADYEISGDERADKVPMPPEILALVGHFIEAHHVEEPFAKRKRQTYRKEKKVLPPIETGGKRYG